MHKRNIVWVLGQTGSKYAEAQPLLAIKNIDLLIFSQEDRGPLSQQTLQKSVDQFNSPSLLIIGDSYLVETSLVLNFLGAAPELWNEAQVNTATTVELINLLSLHFAQKDSKTKIKLNKTKHIADINGQTIKLTSREFDILDHLLVAPDRTVARADFFSSVWSGLKVCNKALDVHVSNLRKKVQPHGIKIRFVRPGSFEILLPESKAENHVKALPAAV